ncbi:RpnC/YadD family protein [Claveliimonas monacensis]
MSKSQKKQRRNKQGRSKEEKMYPVPNRNYKSSIFTMLFSDKKELLGLYNAVSGKDYKDPGLLEVNTLENAIYMAIKNDLSFVIDSQLSLYEHQSTYSPNLPLRMLLYLADLYADMTKNENLYGKKKVKIPPPQFIIFYNGVERQPDRRILRLSDLYEVEEEEHKLELEAVMLNVNAGHNRELLQSCKTLAGYAEYTACIRKYAEEMDTEDAVECAIAECIQEGVLEEFLRKNRAEAKRMSIYEYDQARHIRQEREDAWEEGWSEGRDEGRQEEKRSVAARLAEMGMAAEQIAQAVGETAAVVEGWLAEAGASQEK